MSTGAALDKNEIDIRVTAFDSGNPVLLRHPTDTHPFYRQDRKLAPAASFSVPASGRYTVRVSAHSNAADTRIKIGPSVALVAGSLAAAERVFAIGSFLFALILVTIAALLFRVYIRRRRDFNLTLQRLYGHTASSASAI